MNVISFCIDISSCKHVIFLSIWWNQETLFWSCEVLESGNEMQDFAPTDICLICVFRQNRYSFSRTCLAPNFQRLAHKQNYFHKHIISRQIKRTGGLCAPLPKHKSTSSKSFEAPSGCVPWQVLLLLNQHMCFYWNYIGHLRYTVRPRKTIIRPQKTIVSTVQNAI
jgi:hypothetical protein